MMLGDDEEKQESHLATRHALTELYDQNIIFTNPTEKQKQLIDIQQYYAISIKPGNIINPEKHFYPNVLNTFMHPIPKLFFNLGNENISKKFIQLNPNVNKNALDKCLTYIPKHFFWAGSDLFHVTSNGGGERQMIIVETNSCPSGQKSMPSKNGDRYSGYRIVLETSFAYISQNCDPTLGELAIMWDKNEMEVGGYAHVLSEISQERIWIVGNFDPDGPHSDPNPPIKWINNIMYVRDSDNKWHSIRACFRYVTQKPWNRIPLNSRTLVMNNIIACLCGGRNKAMAAFAYKALNDELLAEKTGLQIYTPETTLNVSKEQIPAIIQTMGGKGVIKVPYSNAGQGVYTIMSDADLQEFIGSKQHYDKYLVQSLVEPWAWAKNSTSTDGKISSKYFHMGTVANRNHKSYVNDIRMMICGGKDGFIPVSVYSRRARKPIESSAIDSSSWDMLGTNLSIKMTESEWSTEANRLILLDRKEFFKLNLNLNDLINGYVQTVLSVIAIDKMCQKLILPNGDFNVELFKELNPDPALINEIHI